MASFTIYRGDGWIVNQDPDQSGNSNLVRFYRNNGKRILLDRIARWNPDAQVWDTRRWVPRSPKVPLWLITWVVAYMRGQAS